MRIPDSEASADSTVSARLCQFNPKPAPPHSSGQGFSTADDAPSSASHYPGPGSVGSSTHEIQEFGASAAAASVNSPGHDSLAAEVHYFNTHSPPILNLSPNLSPTSDQQQQARSRSRSRSTSSLSSLFDWRVDPAIHGPTMQDIQNSLAQMPHSPDFFSGFLPDDADVKSESPTRKRRKLSTTHTHHVLDLPGANSSPSELPPSSPLFNWENPIQFQSHSLTPYPQPQESPPPAPERPPVRERPPRRRSAIRAERVTHQQQQQAQLYQNQRVIARVRRRSPVQRRRSTRENRESRSESQERRRAWQEAVAHDLHDPRDFPERLMNLPPSSSSSSSPSSSPSTTVAQSSVAQSSSYSSTSSTSSSTSSSGSSTMLPRHPFWDMEQFTHWPITYGGVPASVCTAPQHLQGVCTGQHCSGGSAGASGGNPWHSVPCSLPHMHAPCIQPGHVATAGLPTHHQHLPLPPHQPQPTMPPMFNTQTQILQQQQQQQQQQHQQQQQQAQQQASFYPQYPPHPPSALSQQQAQSLSSQQHQMHSSVAAAAAAATVAAAQYQHVLQQSHQIHSRAAAAAAAVAAATSSHLSLHSHQRRNEEDMLQASHRDQHNTQQQHHTHQQPSHHHQQQQQLPHHPLHHPASHHHPHHPFTPSSTASGVSSHHHHHHHHHMNHIPLPTTAGIHGLHQAPAGPGAHNPHQGPVLLQQPDVHATPHDLYHFVTQNHPFGGRYRRSSSGNSSPRSRRSWANIPGPPPPYPGFLIHFLAAIGNPPFPLPTGGAQNHYHIGELGDGDVNGDVENYEALLNLAERLGEAKPRGLLKSDIEQLPSYRYSVDGSGKKAVLGMSGSTSPSPSTRQEQSSCVVCMSDFEPRQMLRLLPCSHEFHGKCVDKWLKTNRTCPICRADGLEGFNNSEI